MTTLPAQASCAGALPRPLRGCGLVVRTVASQATYSGSNPDNRIPPRSGRRSAPSGERPLEGAPGAGVSRRRPTRTPSVAERRDSAPRQLLGRWGQFEAPSLPPAMDGPDRLARDEQDARAFELRLLQLASGPPRRGGARTSHREGIGRGQPTLLVAILDRSFPTDHFAAIFRSRAAIATDVRTSAMHPLGPAHPEELGRSPLVEGPTGRALREPHGFPESRLPDSNRRPEDVHGGRRNTGSLTYSPPLYH